MVNSTTVRKNMKFIEDFNKLSQEQKEGILLDYFRVLSDNGKAVIARLAQNMAEDMNEEKHGKIVKFEKR